MVRVTWPCPDATDRNAVKGFRSWQAVAWIHRQNLDRDSAFREANRHLARACGYASDLWVVQRRHMQDSQP